MQARMNPAAAKAVRQLQAGAIGRILISGLPCKTGSPSQPT
ncbi:hypothetical protein BOO71_0014632 [Deinococcus marmoris]|uniref:Uncharacterized protein n=1 Tax=Deinococcus marmoris TaxID=249408 RepID=A0A1U7NRJ9_9DEIO|nr:hypothetical protein BOO71_0014632 [Deinococcus marmoris]